jgi:hypothetical protein
MHQDGKYAVFLRNLPFEMRRSATASRDRMMVALAFGAEPA